MKKICCLILLFLLTITACTTQDGTIYAPTTQENTSAEADAETSAEYSSFDLTDTWDLETSTTILFDGEAAQISGDGAALAEGTLLIEQEGTYVLQGEFSGSVQVTLAKTEKAQLVLDGVNINCGTTAAINITSADKVVVTLAPGSENTLSDGSDYVTQSGAEPNACLFSKDDLTINGTGALTVLGNCNNGIGTKNDLKIVSGTLTVNASKNALKGNDSVRILDGSITVTMCADAIKSDNETEPDKGFVTISGGTLECTCADDGIQAVNSVAISGASVTVTAADKAVNCDGAVNIEEGCLITK
ncbi:MAG: carbohydrate-binding domain-containing protein [Clostridiales bacterium]|nr:carbohydrate-binding domain-containing protein [Clostridiales bacterium]